MHKAIFKLRCATKHALFLALSTLAFDAQALSPSEVFNKVKDSVVVVKTLDEKGKLIGQGSGVLLPTGKIGTNCHVVKNGASFQVGSGKQFVMATVWGSDEDKDICLLDARGLTSKPAQIGQAMRLKVGEPVYAVGAPRGLELSLSDGIVSQLRGGPPPFIQTTAAISPGSSGGGLFNADGRLVGFTTLYIEGGQSLNFAMPVEWVKEIQAGKKVVQGRSEIDWLTRATALDAAQNSADLLDWCEQWTQAQPRNSSAWVFLGFAYFELNRHTEAFEAFRQALHFNPEDSSLWSLLGSAYVELKRYTEAIEPLQQSLHINPEDGSSWVSLGFAYSRLNRHSEAIEAYQQAIRIDPKDDRAWRLIAMSYDLSGNRTAALEAVSQLRRIDPAHADELLKLILTVPPTVVRSGLAAGFFKVGGDDTVTIFINPASVRRSGNMAKMWSIDDEKTAQTFANGKTYMSTRTQSEYDCEQEQARQIYLSAHSGNMAGGELVYTNAETGKWIPVPPGSMLESLWKYACSKR